MCPETVVKKEANWVPIAVTPTTIAIATRPAIKPYSMAVTPLSCMMKFFTSDTVPSFFTY